MAMQSRIEQHINIEKAIEKFNTKQVLKVGWPERSRYPAEQGGAYVAEVAAKNEYGFGVPPRPFMGPAIDNNRTSWMTIVKHGAKSIANGDSDLLTVFKQLGGKVQGHISKSISQVTSPPLAPATIMARLNKYKNKKKVGALDKPLVDSALMLDSIAYVIEDE